MICPKLQSFVAVALLATTAAFAGEKKVALIAGTKSHGPGDHEYEKGMKLLARCIATSPNARGIRTELHLDGWPKDERSLDDADTIVLFCDGSDRDENAHPILRGERLKTLDRLMKKGVGLVAIHYSVFVPQAKAGARFLDWIGGYFDYESGDAPNHWHSRIQNVSAHCAPAAKEHPINRGVAPFDMKEEYYYKIRFKEHDERWKPILTAAIPGDVDPWPVAWAVERADGGRGFGYTGGHYHKNWGVENARRLVLNAILWTAHADVPAGGVISLVSADELDVNRPAAPDADAIRALIVTGHQHPAHDWRATTTALEQILGDDPRFRVSVSEDPEALASPRLGDFDVIVLNYMNFERPELSEPARAGFMNAVREGKGLVLVHFANGGFAGWPDFQTLARRVWVEGKSGHDPYGPFRIEPTKYDHPVTASLSAWDTTDELYFNQVGDAAIEPLVTAKSKVTGKDEPLAFAYDVGKGRVFQSLLGHDAASIRSVGTANFLRRAIAWAARKEPRTVESKQPPPAVGLPPKTGLIASGGRFGAALDARAGGLSIAGKPEYRNPPLTIECWAKLDSKAGYNILIAHEPKESGTHWEIYTAAGAGTLEAYVPGLSPPIVRTRADITDGRWHHVAMQYEPRRLRLFVDAKQVADTPMAAGVIAPKAGPLWIGAYPPQGIGCAGFIDEVRLRRGIHAVTLPTSTLNADEHTIGLWPLDKIANDVSEDRSPLKNHALTKSIETPSASRPGPTGAGTDDYRLADDRLKLELIDRVDHESLLSLRADSKSNLFAGGKEGLFVYEPDGAGKLKNRRELYRFPKDSWVNDILVSGDDLYVMTNAALYLFPQGRVKRGGLKPKRLIWGWPVDLHVTLHGMAWGPEGDLYFTAGDPLLNYGDFQKRPDHWGHWTVFCQPEGTKIPYTGQGGVFSCKPDGSGFRVVARGTRGSFGLCFDKRWNLFVNDNDHESIPDRYSPARLLHVFEGADFSWPRGWMSQLTPDRADLLPSLTDKLGREAPVGMTYLDDPFWPEPFRGSLILARWGQRRIDAYRLIPKGSSFTTEEVPLLRGENQARPVGVCIAADGSLYATICYMQANEWSPAFVADLVRIEPKARAVAARRHEIHPRASGAGQQNLPVRPARFPLTNRELLLYAVDDDPIVRRIASDELARRTIDHIESFVNVENNKLRLTAVVALGTRLTVPPATGALPAELPLAYESKNAEFVIQYADAKIDLRSLGRVGSFTIAEKWKSLKHTDDEERLFHILMKCLDDADETVRKQSAFYLNLLDDPRSQPLVDQVLARGSATSMPAALGPVSELMRDRLKGAAVDLSAFQGINWETARAQGDSERGRSLFGSKGLGCVRCHAIQDGQAVQGGPSLAGAGKRLTAAHVAESLIEPSKQIAEGFRATSIALVDGRVITALVVNETKESLDVLLGDATRETIRKSDVEERKLADVSPMPTGLVRSPQELKDLLVYVLGENPKAPD